MTSHTRTGKYLQFSVTSFGARPVPVPLVFTLHPQRVFVPINVVPKSSIKSIGARAPQRNRGPVTQRTYTGTRRALLECRQSVP
jgi:hypothetical protein